MKALKWIALVIVALFFTLALLVIVYLKLEPIAKPPAPLRDHPNAHWSGGVDGGTFFEITLSEPPRYFLEIRDESGDIWAQGWVKNQDQLLTNTDFLGYYGGETVELKSGKQLRLENSDGTPVRME